MDLFLVSPVTPIYAVKLSELACISTNNWDSCYFVGNAQCKNTTEWDTFPALQGDKQEFSAAAPALSSFI